MVFSLVQVLVFNRIWLFDMAMPLMVVYFIIALPRGYPRWGALLWSFFLGLGVDMFCNTPGVNAASLTIIGMIQPYLLELFVPRDSAENLEVSVPTLGVGKFMVFSAILLMVYCLVFFALEAFSFYNWQHWLICAGTSSLLTFVLIMAIESVRKK